MDVIGNLLSAKLLILLEEADTLFPSEKITFQLMEDKNLLKSSAGAATEKNIIFYDPKRITEYMLAHEIMHLILDRSGWPEVLCLVPSNMDNFSKRLADTIDNTFDHFNFYKRLNELGLDESKYRDWFVRKIQNWPRITEENGPAILWNAFNILEAMLFGDSYRKKAIDATKKKTPRALSLALQFEQIFNSVVIHTKQNSRNAIINLIDLLNGIISHQTKQDIRLKERIGISPLFTEDELYQPAISYIDYLSRRTIFTENNMWMVSLVLKSDNSHIYSYCIPNANFELPELLKIK